jgi:hypothetical protein
MSLRTGNIIILTLQRTVGRTSFFWKEQLLRSYCSFITGIRVGVIEVI